MPPPPPLRLRRQREPRLIGYLFIEIHSKASDLGGEVRGVVVVGGGVRPFNISAVPSLNIRGVLLEARFKGSLISSSAGRGRRLKSESLHHKRGPGCAQMKCDILFVRGFFCGK